LALSVPLSRFTSQVGGGSAFFVRPSRGTMLTKRTFSLLLIFLGCFVLSCSKPATPESRFRELFADLSIGVPDYQTLAGFTQPEDAIKGDVCTADFSQSETQFTAFVTRLGVSQSSVLSSTGVWVTASSKLDPKYPWMLIVHADCINAPDKIYRVHIDGRQPYD
jgi:hypothetical protein